jgi:hypothetical protein
VAVKSTFESEYQIVDKEGTIKWVWNVDGLFSIISHDLRGPFNGFIGLTNLMADDADSMTKDEMADIAAGIRKTASNVFELFTNTQEKSYVVFS